MKVIVAKTVLSHSIKSRCRDRATERAARAETRIISEDQQNVGGTLWGEVTAFGKSGLDSLALRPMTPLNGGSGTGSKDEPPVGADVP